MKYKTESINGVDVVKFTKKDVMAYLEECIKYWRCVRDAEVDGSKAVLICNRIDIYQAVYESLFGYTYPR
jgi:hypothetical protein